jgi:hypothetical protein
MCRCCGGIARISHFFDRISKKVSLYPPPPVLTTAIGINKRTWFKLYQKLFTTKKTKIRNSGGIVV